MSPVGVKPLSARDWLFGSRPRRVALETLLADPQRNWSKADLARAVGVSPHGGIDEQIAGLSRLGLLAEDGRGWRLADPDGPLVKSLKRLLRQLPSDEAKPST
jgi:hypothetical protein